MIGIWLGTFKYNCSKGQLKNEGRGELHEIKQNRDKTEIDKEISKHRVNKYLLKALMHELHEIVLRHEK